MRKVRQTFEKSEIADVAAAVREQLNRPEIDAVIRSRGPNVAVGVGSRGIDRIEEIVKTTVDCLIEKGARPFIVPAMGSHGGATTKGQRSVLEHLGISEQSIGVPIEDSMEVEQIGVIPAGVPIYLAKAACQADWILPINRIKPHTDFEGDIQSGIIKLLGIGLGKQKGCMSMHEYGSEHFPEILPQIFSLYLESGRVGFGLAVIENAFDRAMVIRAIECADLLDEERSLQKLAKKNMARILLDEIDVLVVERFGKDISGAGMDTNIIGRTTRGPKKDYVGPDIKRIVVLDLTEKTMGNACAISNADFITRQLFERIDFQEMYMNALSSYSPGCAKIPMIAKDEGQAIGMAVRSVPGITMDTAKIVRIKDTAHLEELWVSDALSPQIERINGIAFCE